jgi:Sulfotransferase family
LWDENTPRKIHAVSPAAKIIVTLRDPVARAHSHFLNLRRTGLELEPSFEKALRRLENKTDPLWKYSHEYVELGMYCGQIRRYLDVFGPAQVLVLLTDDLASDPLETFARIAQYLGIDPEPFQRDDLAEAHNSFRTPRLGGLYALVRDSWVKKAVMQHLPDKVQGWLRESPMLFNYEAGKRPVLDETSRKMLQEIYDPEICRLEKLLGRQFPELRKSWV